MPLGGHRLLSTRAIANVPQPCRLWRGQALIREASNPSLYCRATPDGRAIVGGEDEEFVDERSRDALVDERARTIAEKAKKLFPHLDTRPAFAWTGTFGGGKTGLPTIGPTPGHPACWAVLGYGGNGTIFSRLAAEIVRTTLAGGTDVDADLFAFRPQPPAR